MLGKERGYDVWCGVEYGGDCAINSFIYGWDHEEKCNKIVTVVNNRQITNVNGNVWKLNKVGTRLVGLAKDGKLFEIDY